MKIRLAQIAGIAAAGLLVTTVPPLGAVERERSVPLRVTWVRPDLVLAGQRPGLTRLLAAAAAGRPLRGVRVRDSRPQIDAGWATGLDHPEKRDRPTSPALAQVYTRPLRGNRYLLPTLPGAP
jgi:hypothetical protein